MIQRVKELNGRNSGFTSGTLNLHFQKEFLAPPSPWKLVEYRTWWPTSRVIAKLKSKGVTGDHVVFSFVSCRVQPLQHRQHPAFRYEGTQDPATMSPEPMAQSEAVKRCCKVLDNFDKSLKLPTLFWAKNPPENTWVSVWQTLPSTLKFLIFWWVLASLQKNYKTWYCMPPTSIDAASDDNTKRKAAPGALLWRKIPHLDAG